jgi:hypothetical protein
MPIARLSWIRLLALALATAAAATPVRAQQVGGGLTGVVRDATGRPIADASVTAIHTDTSVTRVAQTDTAGRYRLVPLPAGD